MFKANSRMTLILKLKPRRKSLSNSATRSFCKVFTHSKRFGPLHVNTSHPPEITLVKYEVVPRRITSPPTVMELCLSRQRRNSFINAAFREERKYCGKASTGLDYNSYSPTLAAVSTIHLTIIASFAGVSTCGRERFCFGGFFSSSVIRQPLSAVSKTSWGKTGLVQNLEALFSALTPSLRIVQSGTNG